MHDPPYVAAVWDAEASVWISESNIAGLVVETSSLPEFFEVASALARELLAENLR
jgi:hypothetical protein